MSFLSAPRSGPFCRFLSRFFENHFSTWLCLPFPLRALGLFLGFCGASARANGINGRRYRGHSYTGGNSCHASGNVRRCLTGCFVFGLLGYFLIVVHDWLPRDDARLAYPSCRTSRAAMGRIILARKTSVIEECPLLRSRHPLVSLSSRITRSW